jgi:membrane-associated protease RseP (regulator of RpoE activity)
MPYFKKGIGILYDDSPAINAELQGAIIEINGKKIDDRERLSEELLINSPGNKIRIKTKIDEEILEYEIILGEHPKNKSLPWLGIGFIEQKKSGRIFDSMSFFKKPNVYYEPKFNGISIFVYNLLWWLVLINFSVALINMLPVGIFDGGRFFYLTMLAITKSEKKAKNLSKAVTYFFLFLLFLLIVFWAWSFI